MAVDATLNLSLVANSTKTAVAGNTPHDPLSLIKQSILTSGTGAGQSDVLYFAERTINASSNDDLDLTGSLTDNLGRTVTQARIKGLIIIAAPSSTSGTANTNNVVLGNAASNQWATLLNTTGTVTLRPGAFFMAWAGQADATGWTVTAATGDIFRVANSGAGTSVTYQIFVLGCSA
jgi:hypothetical protein